ncbi:MAG: winged helix-turn-helix transcriptional regulator, partial [Candidatus Omnitrophica bacterium]|nr:winged helix-turn-helix transcriptional regulator [Candidatus Omnitrophota bacterium]
MSKEFLDEREFELINIIGPKLGLNQRDISKHMNISLGMINMLIRRLIAKGFIRIKQLNKRKVEYILTPKGLAEKMKKSVKYTLKTINSIGLIKKCFKEVLSGLV